MNTQKGFSLPIIIGLVVVLTVIGGAMYFNARPEAEKMMDMGKEMKKEGESMMKDGEVMIEEGESMMKDGEKMMEGDVMMEKTSGRYEDYSPEKVAQADGNAIIFFHAKWCPTCRGLDNDITRNLEDIPSGVIILKADYDSETKLKQKYGVTIQHTLVQVDVNGELVGKWFGNSTLASVVDEIK